MTMGIRVASLVCLLALGCGAAAQPPPQDATTTATDVTPIAGPPQPWAEMTSDERRRYMTEHVLPTMSALFMEYDPERYADCSCTTCHGHDARTMAFQMPNQLPALWPSGTPEQRAMVQRHPDMARFMFNRVLPTMTRLLGQPEWNNEDKTGFGCFNCHAHGEVGITPTP